MPRSAPGLELGGLRAGVDGSDAEGEGRGLLRRVCALVVGMGNAVDEGAGKRLRLVRGTGGRKQRKPSHQRKQNGRSDDHGDIPSSCHRNAWRSAPLKAGTAQSATSATATSESPGVAENDWLCIRWQSRKLLLQAEAGLARR